MQWLGKYMFWTLVTCNLILLVVYLNAVVDESEEYSPLYDGCVRECFMDSLPQEQEEVQQTIGANLTEAEQKVTEAVTAGISTEKLEEITTTAIPLVVEEANPWLDCPLPGLGRKSTFLTCYIDGRLGNAVWSYLSIWAGAKRHNLRPLFNEDFLHRFLYKIFNESALKIPTAQMLDAKCNTGDFFTNQVQNTSMILLSTKDTFRYLEKPPKTGYHFLKYGMYIFNSEDLVPSWNELKTDLVLKEEFTSSAQRLLATFRLQEMEKLNFTDLNMATKIFEYVGIHARMTDYIHHMSAIFPGSTTASPQFYSLAMDWMTKMVGKPLIFVIVSDDNEWAFENIAKNRTNTYMGGNGDLDNPGYDLALLAACNHTIFAYGTFALTGALLASQPGGFNVVFDPLNGTITKEMEFAANLPGWRIMDNDGNFNYEDKKISYAYFVHPRET